MQKRFLALALLLVLAISIASSQNIFCCKDQKTYQDKCYSDGQCCNGLWYQRCVDFEIWASKNDFTVGVKQGLPVYVRNIGAYSDTYTLDVTVLSGRVLVDWKNGDTITVPVQSTYYFEPKITFLAAGDAAINFVVTSKTDPSVRKETTLTISANSFYSMSEFSTLSTLFIVLGSIAILSFSFKRIYRKA